MLRIIASLVSLDSNSWIDATPPRLFHSANVHIADYIIRTTTDVAVHALELEPTENKRSGLLRLSDKMHNRRCGFNKFVSNIIRRSQTRTTTVLVALLYLKRAKFDLDVPPVEWILYRLFMGALILATKVCRISRPVANNCDY
jgi:hypothetical protein